MTRTQQLLLRCSGRAGILAAEVWAIVFVGMFAGLWRMRGIWLFYAFCTVVCVVAIAAWAQSVRERLIREAPLPRFLQRKLREAYPHFTPKDCALVERGLRQFFLACLRSRQRFVAMPSRAVDTLWHEFILHTQAYRDWCRDAMGFFLHHTPAETLGQRARNNDGLRRAWFWACKDEAIDPRAPTRLPLLFALDAKLGIANGFHYVPDCSGMEPKTADGGTVHCGTSFSDGGYSGDAGDFGGADADSGGDGDGGGGDGCGGGGGD